MQVRTGQRRRSVLIETLWNVKLQLYSSNLEPHSVLIETLWNVKSFLNVLDLPEGFVLIETLWNVKKKGESL